MSGNDRLTSPAVARNRDPILDVLRRMLPARGLVLEVASGTGEHAAYFSQRMPGLVWQPTDADPANMRSIAAWTSEAGSFNLMPPLLLDAAEPSTWPVRSADAILAVNLIHIAPWDAAAGLLAGAASILSAGGPLILYGPYREGGRHTAESNAAFDAELRARNPNWGVRDLAELAELAALNGLALRERVAMPANNLAVTFRRLPA